MFSGTGLRPTAGATKELASDTFQSLLILAGFNRTAQKQKKSYPIDNSLHHPAPPRNHFRLFMT